MDARLFSVLVIVFVCFECTHSRDYGRCIIMDHVKQWTAYLQIRFDCSARGLTEVPWTKVPKFASSYGVTHIFLQRNKIKHIEPGVFNHTGRFSFLRYLDLSDNPIQIFDAGAFDGLGSLELLNMRNNFTIHTRNGSSWADVFRNLSKLRVLKTPVLYNQTHELVDAVKNIPNLESLSLVLQNNMVLPPGMDKLQNLRKIEFTKGEPIDTLNLTVQSNVTRITSLSFAWADITKIPPATVNHFSSINELILSGNSRLSLKRARGLFSKMPDIYLKRLSLDHVNKYPITLYPDAFCMFNLRNLTHLSLRANNIIRLELEVLACLPRLQYLALGFNLLTIIEPMVDQNDFFSFGTIPLPFKVPGNLAFIDLSNRFGTSTLYDQLFSDSTGEYSNDFFSDSKNFFYEAIPCDPHKSVIINGTEMYYNPGCLQLFTYVGQYLTLFGQLVPFNYSTTLRYLDVSFAQVVQTTIDTLNPMPNLEYLDMCCAGIKSIADDLLVHSPELRLIHMSHNQLGRGSNNFTAVFRYQTQLRELYLKDNFMVSIAKDAFFNLTSLQALDLSSNQFTILDTLLTSPELQLLDLKHNVLSGNMLSPMTRQSILNHTVNFTDVKLSLYPYVVCTCKTLDFAHWLATSAVKLDFFRFYLNCSVSGEEMDYEKGLDQLRNSKECINSYLQIIISLSVLFSVIFIVAAITYRYRLYIKWIYYTKRQSVFGVQLQPETSHRIRFHAYIAVAIDDLRWVKDNLLPQLEHEWDLTAYLYERDSIGGIAICDNIIYGMSRSSCVIVVLSRNFIEENWREFELNMVIGSRKVDTLFIIEIDDMAPEYSRMSKLLRQLLKPGSGTKRIEWNYANNIGREVVWSSMKEHLDRCLELSSRSFDVSVTSSLINSI